MKILIKIFLLLFFYSQYVFAALPIQPGATQFDLYLPLLKGKRVGLFANHSSLVQGVPLVDELIKHHVHVVKLLRQNTVFEVM